MSDREAAELVAMSEEACVEARGPDPDSARSLSQDQLLRISGILGIYQSLELFFSGPLARDWFTKPNDGPLAVITFCSTVSFAKITLLLPKQPYPVG
ncbi:hypothetical protein [Thalassorhabdomicrobium marinisediminis]|uniref:hypothetical protein n=1 Tax=Thalassorhabdomicrobium marinisediminis TaxID=2170577 RepID=UPI00248FBBDA|nr:hypothetical protein [Thalassorhabdomicrobium marinisediminis]